MVNIGEALIIIASVIAWVTFMMMTVGAWVIGIAQITKWVFM